MKKLFAFDLDGTILSEAHDIQNELVSQLKHISDDGHLILINTGRTCAYSRHILKNLKFDFFASFTNGVALVEFLEGGKGIKPTIKKEIDCPSMETKKGYLIYEKNLPPGLIPEILKIFSTNGIDPVFQRGITGNDLTYNMELQFPTEELLQILSEDPERRVKVDSFDNFDSSDFVSVFGCTNDEEGAFNLTSSINQIKGLYSVAFRHSYMENSFWITVGSEYINKGIPVERIMKDHGINRQNVFAFGNDRNDIPMLLQAGHPVAIVDSPQDVLEIANEVVAKPDEGGVLSYLERIIYEKTKGRF